MTYRDARLPIDVRADDLLSQMTLPEKLAQLVGIFPFAVWGPDGVDRDALAMLLGDGIGELSLLTAVGPDDPAPISRVCDAIQGFLVNETRLGIPAMSHSEALSGLVQSRAANFPTAVALAATWCPGRVELMADVIRRQTRALGITHALSPVLDVARDTRWGRIHETYGEDPYLCSAMGVAFIRGLQGPNLREGVIATGKHFLGYALSEGGRNIGSGTVAERELYDVLARPFEAAIREAGLASVMNSYSEINGEVPTGSKRLLTELLRGRLGFDGFVCADYGSVAMLHDRHSTATSYADAGVLALGAGLDMELPERHCFSGLEEGLQDGTLDLHVVDESVRRVLVAKLRLGLFENPYANLDGFAGVDEHSHRELARELAVRSAVLLKNEGALLPLPKDLARIAVIGPNADSVRNLFSAYTAPAMAELRAVRAADDAHEKAPDMDGARLTLQNVTELPMTDVEAVTRAAYPQTRTVLAAVRDLVSAETDVVHVGGCGVNDRSTDGIAQAVAAAEATDVAILVLGDKTGWVADATSGEGRDRSSLALPGVQEQLLAAVCATGTPVVVVLVNGRPTPVGVGEGGPRAVLEAWQPGSTGAVHIAELLFGDATPSGKLPITVPRSAGQCPIYHYQNQASSYAASGVRRYTDAPTSPAYAFGHGLSYTTFAYRDIAVTPTEIDPDGVVDIAVEVANTGIRAGEEVVQLYATAPVRGLTRPVHELVGFHRILLEPGESSTIVFRLEAVQLACLGVDMLLGVHPGRVTLAAGGSSSELPVTTSFTITGERLLLAHRRTFLSTSHAHPTPK